MSTWTVISSTLTRFDHLRRYSPWELDLEKPGGVIEVARELGISIVAYSPTGRGIITGRYVRTLPAARIISTVHSYSLPYEYLEILRRSRRR
jgi:aryl-alcohol dehydrogenase-like predicted oxidoreductase